MTQVLQLKMYKYAFDSMYPLTGLIQLSKRRKNPYARSEVMKLLDVVGLNGVGHIKGFFTTCICELSIKEKGKVIGQHLRLTQSRANMLMEQRKVKFPQMAIL